MLKTCKAGWAGGKKQQHSLTREPFDFVDLAVQLIFFEYLHAKPVRARFGTMQSTKIFCNSV